MTQKNSKKANQMKLEFDGIPENEGFARVAVASFFTQLNPTLEEIADVKTAVSEAVTNAIIHGYAEDTINGVEEGKNSEHQEIREMTKIWIRCELKNQAIDIEIEDRGCGIPDIEKAMEPMYTTRPELERSGMGFAFMEAFMDELSVESMVGIGTKVKMRKILSKGTRLWTDPSN